MDYILQHTPEGTRPKVLAHYGSSGYVMFRGEMCYVMADKIPS